MTYVEGWYDAHALPWAGPWPWSPRCRARREPGSAGGHHGRCELAPHPEELDHALERGFDTPRWSTRWTG